jgi:hypothetical protein
MGAPAMRGGGPPAMGGGAPRGTIMGDRGGVIGAPPARGGGPPAMSGAPSRGNFAGPGFQRHHRRPFIGYGFAAPYLYDDSWPYYSYYGDSGCWAIRYVRGAYRRVWVCY